MTSVKNITKVYRKEGMTGIMNRIRGRIVPHLDPILFLFYPSRKVSQETEKSYTAAMAVDMAMHKLGKFIRPMQIPPEFQALAEVVETLQPKTVVEIGTAQGGTLFAWTRLADRQAKFVSIDMPFRFDPAFPRWKEKYYRTFAGKEQSMSFLRINSHDPAGPEEVKRLLGAVDFMFIDGDHSYEGVKKDYEMYIPLVRKGGVIAFHDIIVNADPRIQVERFWNEVKVGKQYKEFIEERDQRWAGIGVLFV